MSDTAQRAEAAKAEPEAKPLWNSLEIAKLAVEAMTPLAIAVFGVFLAYLEDSRAESRARAAEERAETRDVRAEKRNQDYIKAAEKRTEEGQAKAEERSAARADAAQEASRKLMIQMADQAADREWNLKSKDRDFAAEQASRTAQIERQNRLIERRSKIWDEVGPKLNAIYTFSCRVGDFDRRTYDDIILMKQESDRVFNTYKPFFSADYIHSYMMFMSLSFDTFREGVSDAERKDELRAAVYVEEYDPRLKTQPGKFVLRPQLADYSRQYNDVLSAAALDLGVPRDEVAQSSMPGIAVGGCRRFSWN